MLLQSVGSPLAAAPFATCVLEIPSILLSCCEFIRCPWLSREGTTFPHIPSCPSLAHGDNVNKIFVLPQVFIYLYLECDTSFSAPVSSAARVSCYPSPEMFPKVD